jgi:hypothetical protein
MEATGNFHLGARARVHPVKITVAAVVAEVHLVVENDTIQIWIGRSSADIHLETTVDVVS